MLCPQCQNEIPDRAKICTRCQSALDWRRHITFGTTTLALLVALLSISSQVIGNISRAYETKRADMRLQLADLSGSENRLFDPSKDTVEAKLFASNLGNRTGLIASINTDLGRCAIEGGPTMIEPKKAQNFVCKISPNSELPSIPMQKKLFFCGMRFLTSDAEGANNWGEVMNPFYSCDVD